MTTQAIFGKPESAAVMTEAYALLLEHATLVERAIHTLECLRELGSGDEDTRVAFVRQSWDDLRRLQAYYRERGVKPADIDLGGFV